jgi:RNA polymerase sigma factor for flagellar operon FliA
MVRKEIVTPPSHNARDAHTAPDPPEVLARIHDSMDLVARMASLLKRQVKTKLSKEELLSFGREGLLRAARAFDPERGVPFQCWAALRVRGAMIDGVRASGDLPRRAYQKLRALQAADALQDALVAEDVGRASSESAIAADARLDAYLADMATVMAVRLVSRTSQRDLDGVPDVDATPEDDLAEAEIRHALTEAITELPAPERTMMQRHYFDDVSLDEAARELGLSRSWGSRLHARAVEMVRRNLKRRRVAP